MEESIGYEALFSSVEWDSLDTSEWSDIDDEFSDINTQSSSGVVADGSGSAALPTQAAPEGVVSPSVGPAAATSDDKSTGQNPKSESESVLLDIPQHSTRIRQVVDELSSEERYEVVCAVCESIGDADSPDEALAIATLHERFVAVLVDTGDLER